MSQSVKRKNDPCTYRYHTNNKNGFQDPKALKLINYTKDVLSIRTHTDHSKLRQEKSKYLTREDANNKDVSIEIPEKINLKDSSNVIFEIGTVEVSGGVEAIHRMGIRMTNTPVKVTGTDTNYNQYDYCLIVQIENPEQPYSVTKDRLITVYLNEKNDWHNTINKAYYQEPDEITV
mgnify:CR=1 FL=1